jgi:hypothetical protein
MITIIPMTPITVTVCIDRWVESDGTGIAPLNWVEDKPRKSQTLRPFKNREGTATRKVKTVSEGAPPAHLKIQTVLKGWATRPSRKRRYFRNLETRSVGVC